MKTKNKNSGLTEQQVVELKDSYLIAEFCFICGEDSFKLYHDKKSSKYILSFWISDEGLFSSANSGRAKFYVCKSLRDSLSTINEIMNSYYTNPVSLITVSERWWSFFPDWMFLSPVLVTEHFGRFAQKAITEVESAIVTENDLIEKEILAIDRWNTCLKSAA